MDFTAGTGIVRTDDHRYYWQDLGPFPGVTTVQKVLYTGEGLMKWAQKIVAEQAVDNAYRTIASLQAGRPKDMIVKELARLPERKRDAAADLGSSVHWHAEQVALGHDYPVPAEEWPFIRQYVAWRDECKPEYVAVEYMGINLTHGYGGTGDLIVRIGEDSRMRPGTWLLDIKSGSYWPETALQLVACAELEFIGKPNDPTKYPVPAVDHFGVLDLKPDGWKVVPYQFDRVAAFEAFASLAALHRWKKSIKSALKEPITGRAEEQINDAA